MKQQISTQSMGFTKALLLTIGFIFSGADTLLYSREQQETSLTAQTEEENVKTEQTPVEAIRQEDALFELIATQNLQGLPLLAGPSLGDAIKDQYAFYNFLTESIINPQAHDTRRRAFKILASAEQAHHAPWMQTSILDKVTIADLNLLLGSKDNPSINLAHILSDGRTRTELGKAYLCGLIARPTADLHILESRQRIIRELVENEALFNELDRLLQEIARHEPFFTGLWDAECIMQFVEENYAKIDWIGDTINKSSLLLELKALFGIGGLAMMVGVMSISPAILTVDGISMLYNGEAVTPVTDLCLGQLGLIFKAFPALENRFIKGTVSLGVGALSALMIKPLLQHVHTKFLIDDFLKKRLMHIARYQEAAEDVAQKISHHTDALEKPSTFLKNINHFFTEQMANDQDLALLNKLLHSASFAKGNEEKLELFFSRGNMLCTYYLLSLIKEKFAGTMAALGELDAFLTAAKLIKESQQKSVSWSLPSYTDKALTPAIALSEFWNPFINTESPVTNSIELGNRYNRPNLVVTGPNSAGKSTILKSIGIAIILAQSLGIAPAQSMVFTPFAYLTSYMNVADSLVDQESRFQAEARRIFEYGDHLETIAEKNAFNFALFDEIFSGTSPIEGADLGYNVAAILGNYSNSMSLIATHFEKLTHLEQDTAGRFINYKVSVGQNNDGSIQCDANNKIKRLFRLTQGISHQHIAREVFKEKGQQGQSGFFAKCFNEKLG